MEDGGWRMEDGGWRIAKTACCPRNSNEFRYELWELRVNSGAK